MSVHIGFLPPCSRGPGLSALFFSLAEQLADCGGPVVCQAPAWLLPPNPLPGHLKIGSDPKTDAPFRLQFILGEPPSDLSAVVVAARPLKSDVVQLRAQISNLFDKTPDLPVRILLWGGEEFPPFEFGSFFTHLIHPVFFPLRDLVQAENTQQLLRQVSSRPAGFKSLKGLVEGLLEDLRTGKNSAPLKRTQLRQFESRVREKFWREIEETPLPENDETAVERVLDRVIEITFLDHRDAAPPARSLQAVRRALLQEIRGYGPLEDLMADPAVTEIMVNGPSTLFIERNGRIEPSLARFADTPQLRSVIDRMVGRMGRRVDTASPMCDLRLENGARVNVVLPPLAPDWPVVTIRRFRSDVKEMDDLIRLGAVTAEEAQRLAEAVRARANILISGNSGSGKTTLLNVLSGFIEPEERILTLEDAAELKLAQPHVVRLETRPKNVEGTGEVTMADLVVNALRMRPDRLVVGECRGSEVIPMLQAMNTGHDGSMTTVHANSASDALRRLESMVLLGAPEWPLEVVRQQIAAGLDVVVHLHRTGAERRLVEMGRFVLEKKDLLFIPEDFT